MANPPVLFQEKLGALSSTSVGKEVTFGTPVTPTSTIPQVSNSMIADPGLFYPQLMLGIRDANVFPLYGQSKNGGAVSGALFPSNGIEFLAAAIGTDASPGNGVTGSTPTSSTTLSAGSAIGATTVTVASAAGYVVGDIVQIDVNASTTTTAECRKISTISVDTLTLDQALAYAHASGAAVAVVVAPFTHTIMQSNILPSLTIEQNFGNFQSLQYAGSRVSKYSLKGAAGNSETEAAIDVISQSYSVLNAPSALTVTNEEPFVFAEYVIEWNGGTIAQANNISVDIENGLKENWTFNGTHDLQFLSATTLKTSGELDVIFDSLNDATWGFFAQSQSGIEAALSVKFVHPTNLGSVTLNMPAVRLNKDAPETKLDDIIMEKLTWTARNNLSSSTAYTVNAVIENSVYLPY